MERRLFEAAQKGNINELNELISSNGLILEEMALEGAGHTPLHVACVAGHLDFVQELLNLMPKLVEKVNADGFSPLHIAAARGDVEIVRVLLRVGEHLCSVKGRERRIPLHYAVVNGELHVMKLLLSAWPESIKETTAREETVFHLAVKNNRFDAIVALVEHLKLHKQEQVINLTDIKGDTALHLAAAVKNFEVVDFMLRQNAPDYEFVKVNVSNKSGLTPLDVIIFSQRGARNREIRELLAKAAAEHGRGSSNLPASSLVSEEDQSDGGPVTNYPQSLSSPSYIKRESWGHKHSAMVVAAALITSATYQAVLQPPSFKAIDNQYTKGSLQSRTLVTDLMYIFFMSTNTFGFLVSVLMIIGHTRRFFLELPLMLSLLAMVLTYLCYTLFVPFESVDKSFSGTRVTLLRVLPLMISVLLMLIQRWLAQVLKHALEWLFKRKFLGGMYSV